MTEERGPGTDMPHAGGDSQERTAAEGHHVRPQAQADLPLKEFEPDSQTLSIIETLLFSSDVPLTLTRLAEIAEVDARIVRKAVDALNRLYEEHNRTFRVHRVAQGFQMYTLPEYSEWVRRMYKRQFVQRLSKASLEVLAIMKRNLNSERAVMMSFVIPSTKYSCWGSSLMLAKGRTAMEGLSGSG